MTPRVYRRRTPRRYYLGLIFFVIIISIVLQFQWMSRVRQAGPDSITPNSLAEKLSHWMLMRRGIEIHDPALLGPVGVQRFSCETCFETGEIHDEYGRNVMCQVCMGVGFRMVRRFDPSDRKCPLCAGMGRVEHFDTGLVGECPRCEGRGLVRSQVQTEPGPEN